MSKNRNSTSSRAVTTPDAFAQNYRQQIMDAASAAGNTPPPGVNPLTTQAAGVFGQAAGNANLGLNAMSGDPNAQAQFMNPYQSGVIGALNDQWGHINQQTQNQVNDRATQAGAFGGSRAAIATGSALSQNNQAQAGQVAGLLNSGFDNAMQRAGTVANFGLNAASQLPQLGDYMRNVQMQQDPNMWRMNTLRQGFSGLPLGNSSTNKSTSTSYGFDLSKIPGQIAGLTAML